VYRVWSFGETPNLAQAVWKSLIAEVGGDGSLYPLVLSDLHPFASGLKLGHNWQMATNHPNPKGTLLPPNYRPRLFVSAGICLVAAAVIEIWFPEREALQGACLRAGIVVTALAFALPPPGQKFRWQGLVPFLAIFIIAVAITRVKIHLLLPALILLAIIAALVRSGSKPRPLR